MNNDAEKNSALIIATLSSFLTPYMSSAINIALPAIGKEFNMNTVLLSWIATSFLLSASMFLLPFGRLADIYGRKKIYLCGIILYTISSLLCTISFSPVMLLFSRILQGIGGAMIFGTSVAILTSVFPIGERGKVLGITNITSSNYLMFIMAIRIAFVIYAVFCFAGIFATMARGKLR